MVYSTIRQTYICSGSHCIYSWARIWQREFYCRPRLNKLMILFLHQNIKTVLDHAIINKKQFVKLLIIRTNKYLSYISENITLIIGKCYMSALCMTDGVQRAILV
jgi:hypothetical protein